MNEENVVLVKSKTFAVRILKLVQYLKDTKKEYTLSEQLLRSGTSIGANVREGNYGQSGADFYTKFKIALKEASETEYWLELLHEGGYLDDKEFDSIYKDANELAKLLTSITKTYSTKN